MKIVVRDANGAEHSFEGSDAELAKAAELIPGFIDGFAPQVGKRTPIKQQRRGDGKKDDELPPDEDRTDERDDLEDDDPGPTALDPGALLARLEEVNAKTDIERVTVLAQAAVDAGLEGLDYETVEDLYRRMGLPMPGKWRSTFSNAHTRGYIYNVGRGRWLPTSKGYNFARLGIKQGRKAPRKRSAGPRTESLLTNGEEE